MRFKFQRLVRVFVSALMFGQAFSGLPLAHAQDRDDPPTDPNPIENPGPTPESIAQAESDGRSDGFSDGAQAGTREGAIEGAQKGTTDGYRRGFDRCEDEEERRAYDRGLQEGYRRGEWDGRREGDSRGELDGRESGRSEGRADGIRRADRDADAAATPPGRERGREEAERSDAAQRGDSEGTIEGDRQARAEAERTDYPRGRKAYRDEMFAQPIQNRDRFSQRDPVVAGGRLGDGNELARFGLDRVGTKSRDRLDLGNRELLNRNPRRTYPTPEENAAYRRGYDQGYSQGRSSTYRQAYDQSYRMAFDQSVEEGCRQARSRDYSDDFRRGEREGYSRGYRSEYDRAYRYAYDEAYRREFQPSSDSAYAAEYPSAYERHFEAARRSAYNRRYKEIYDAAFEAARFASYQRQYPGYAAAAFERGRADEAADFRLRPVRLLEAGMEESIGNGLLEPLEALSIRMLLRNFASEEIRAQDLRITATASDASLVVVELGDELLRRPLRGKSLTEVTQSFRLRATEAAHRKQVTVTVRAQYQGRDLGSQTLVLNPLFWVETSLAEAPVFQEGMETVVKLRLKNNSTSVASPAAAVNFVSASPELELLNPKQSVVSLGVGQERVLEFAVVANIPGDQLVAKLGFSVMEGERRIGLLDETRRVPVRNEYRIAVTKGKESLRSPTLSRLSYTVRNVGSDGLFKSLQVSARVEAANPAEFEIVGPNPQLLSPINRAQETTFTIPVMVKSANGGGVLILEVREDGRTVVVHRLRF